MSSNDDQRSLLSRSNVHTASYTEPERKRSSRPQAGCASTGVFKIRGRSPFYKLAQNAQAGMTVALVNVPLSISLAVASGVSPAMGVVTAIWSGFVAAACGGSHFNVVGPTGALSGLLFRYSVDYGVEVMAILAFMSAGLLSIVYVLGLDSYVMFLPNAVNVGFTLGVAFIIGAGQIPNAFGLTGLPLHHELIQNLGESVLHLTNFEWFSAIVFTVSWFSLYNCQKRWPRVPWSILLSMVGIALGYLSSTGSIHHLNTLNSKYGNLRAELTLPVIWKPEYSTNFMDLLSASSSIAFVAVLETLISGKIAESNTNVHMHSRREVFGVTMANFGSAMAGGMPATAALARTALNIRSGAYSRVSGMLNGVFTAIFAVVVMPAFQYLPLPIVAAMVAQVAVGMVDTTELKHYWKLSPSTFYLTISVALLCVAMDPTKGIVFGVVVGLFQNAQQQSSGHNVTTIGNVNNTHDSHYEDNDHSTQIGGEVPPPADAPFTEKMNHTFEKLFCDPDADDIDDHNHISTGVDVLTYSFAGSLSFVNVGQHVARIRRYVHQRPNVCTYILSLETTHYFDVDGLLGLQEITKEIEHAGRTCIIVTGIRPSVLQLTSKSEWIASLQKRGRVFVSNAVAYKAYVGGVTNTHTNANNGYTSLGDVIVDNGYHTTNGHHTNGMNGVVNGTNEMDHVAAVLRRPSYGNGNGMYPSLERKT